MCGIVGILYFDKKRKISKPVLKKMNDTIKHRGPDGDGLYINKNIGFGHRRLSIIDLNTGDQPMFNYNKSIAVVLNGEIYNYIELRDELKKKGHNFRTKSDTEVLIHAYEEWGYECQNKFNGMWAFALWDEDKKVLFLSRDRIGIKPINYAVWDNAFIFGSEIKSILAYGFPVEPNYEVLEIYLSLCYIPAPFSFYKNIYKLEPGHYLIVQNGEIKIHQFWDLPGIDRKNMVSNSREAYEKFEYLLKDSVRLRMRSDVPYGAFLSGGLDSSSVVALMSEISDYPVETFTIGFEVKEYDERKLAREAAYKFNTNHHEKLVKEESFDESLGKNLFHFDEPFGDSSVIPTGYVAKYAREFVKMVLTGDGGDEVLSGYTIYQGEKFASQYMKIPSIFRAGLFNFFYYSSVAFSGKIRYKLNRIIKVLNSSELDFNERLISKEGWIEKKNLKEILYGVNNRILIEDYISDFMKKCTYKDNFYKLMYFHLKNKVVFDMLTKVDRMTMAHSLEARTPFLDYRIVEFLINVEKKIKMEGYERKSILRKSIGEKLPKSLLKARKQGFGVPLGEWFKKREFESRLNKLSNLTNLNFNVRKIKEVINHHKTGKTNYENFIWMLIVLNSWLESKK